MPLVSSSPDRGPKRVRLGIVVPSRERGAALLRVTPLPKGAGSFLSVIGDFRPLFGSKRCADLTGDHGPIGRVTGRGPGGFDFGFDRSPDPDRSWEAAVVFAVLALRTDHVDLVAPGEADVVVVAHGSVDADLSLGAEGVGRDAGVSTERWSAAVTDGSRRVVRIEATGGADEAGGAGRAGGDGARRLDPASVERIVRPYGDRPVRRHIRRVGAAVAAVIVCGGAVVLATTGLRSPPPEPPPPSPPMVQPVVPTAVPSGGADADVATAVADPARTGVGGAFRVRLLAVSEGHRCEEVVFGAVEPLVVALPETPPILDLAGRAEICGVDVAATASDRRIELRLPPSVRPGTIERSSETNDGKTLARVRLFFGTGIRRLSEFEVVAVAEGDGAAETLVVRPPKP
jgi:hypothetical protein